MIRVFHISYPNLIASHRNLIICVTLVTAWFLYKISERFWLQKILLRLTWNFRSIVSRLYYKGANLKFETFSKSPKICRAQCTANPKLTYNAISFNYKIFDRFWPQKVLRRLTSNFRSIVSGLYYIGANFWLWKFF